MAWQAGDTGRPEVLIHPLEALDPTPVLAWRDPLAFLEPMDWTVSSAMYWQAPHAEDVAAADPGLVAALRPVAEAVASSPASAWWSTPVDLAALRYASRFDDDHPPSPPTLTDPRERLDRWRAGILEEERAAASKRPADLGAPISGYWWSSPEMASLVTTTRPLEGLGSIELGWEEDSFGQRSAVIACAPTRLAQDHRPRRWLAHSGLARRRRRVGRGPLVRRGYLTTATRALDVGDGDSATVLAGWDPDQTWWLTDALATTASHPESWENADQPSGPDLAWRRTSP